MEPLLDVPHWTNVIGMDPAVRPSNAFAFSTYSKAMSRAIFLSFSEDSLPVQMKSCKWFIWWDHDSFINWGCHLLPDNCLANRHQQDLDQPENRNISRAQWQRLRGWRDMHEYLDLSNNSDGCTCCFGDLEQARPSIRSCLNDWVVCFSAHLVPELLCLFAFQKSNMLSERIREKMLYGGWRSRFSVCKIPPALA